MPLLRIIFENGQLWTDLLSVVTRASLVPVTLASLSLTWAAEDIQHASQVAVWTVSEILHIVPCVLGQLGIIHYEPVEEIRKRRIEVLKNEKHFWPRLYKRVTMKYTTGIHILIRDLNKLQAAVEEYFTRVGNRYSVLLAIWVKTEETEEWVLHYPRCFVRIVAKNVFGENETYTRKGKQAASKRASEQAAKKAAEENVLRPYNLGKQGQRNRSQYKRRDERQAKKTKPNPNPSPSPNPNSRKKASKRVIGVQTLPPTTINIGNQSDFAERKMIQEVTPTPKSGSLSQRSKSAFKQSERFEKTKSLPIDSVLKNKSSQESSFFKQEDISSPLEPVSANDLNKEEQGSVVTSGKSRLSALSPAWKKKKYSNREVEFFSKKGDYEAVKRLIISVLDNKNFDDGSLGPLVVRLSWHCCATYDKETGTGGSNGATIRLIPEITDPGNTGLEPARVVLEMVKQQFPWISYADLYTFAGVTAIEAMGGPKVEWKPGRTDCITDQFVPKNGRLPIGSKHSDHIRAVFNRMGFNDQEIVCLIGAHTLGRTHKKYSGWEGKWTNNPIKFDNEFYKLLLNDEWDYGVVPQTGNQQYFNRRDKDIMMLQTDMELVTNPDFRKWVELYANDQDKYFEDFAKAYAKLLELGIERNEEGIALKTR